MEDVNTMFGGDAEAIDVPEIVEPVVEAVVEPTPVVETPVVESKPVVPDGYVPVGVVKELRDEIRSLKQAPVQQTPAEELYPDEDTLKIANANLRSQAMTFSQMMAEDKFGSDVVKTAHDWAFDRCNNDPAFNLAVAQSPHPYKFIVEEHRKAQSLQELGNVDPEQVRAFKQWQAAQAQIPVQQPAAVVPQSIVSATSAGSSVAPKEMTAEEKRLASMF